MEHETKMKFIFHSFEFLSFIFIEIELISKCIRNSFEKSTVLIIIFDNEILMRKGECCFYF